MRQHRYSKRSQERRVLLASPKRVQSVEINVGVEEDIDALCVLRTGIVAGGTSNGRVCVWDVRPGRPVCTAAQWTAHAASVMFLSAPDAPADLLATAAPLDPAAVMCVWAWRGGRFDALFAASASSVGALPLAYAVAWPARTVAALCSDGTLTQWHLDAPRPVFVGSVRLAPYPARPSSVTFVDDARPWLVLVAHGPDLFVHDLRGHAAHGWPVHPTATADGPRKRHWDPCHRTYRLSFEAHLPDSVVSRLWATSANDAFVSCSNSGVVKLWDAMSGRGRSTLAVKSSENRVQCVAVNGAIIATGHESGGVRLWPLRARASARAQQDISTGDTSALGNVTCGRLPIRAVCLDSTLSTVVAADAMSRLFILGEPLPGAVVS